MKPALVLVDLQRDFLSRPGLVPTATDITRAAGGLLEIFRARGLPVLHVHTRVAADGSDCMPHWRRQGTLSCVAGTPGGLPPPALAPTPEESRVFKRCYSGFEDGELDRLLRALQADTVVLAGIYLHGCIRATALDAYAGGYTVLVADDAVGSTEALHAEVTREYLEGRAATFLPCSALSALVGGPSATAAGNRGHRVACIAGRWLESERDGRLLVHRPPADTRRPGSTVAAAGREVVVRAAAAALSAREPWSHSPLRPRVDLVARWRAALDRSGATLVEAMVAEIGKPLRDAQEELQRCLAVLDACVALAAIEEQPATGVAVRYRPVGTIGIVTPWNNPVALPAGKIASALVYGNGVVWKPSPMTARVSALLMDTLAEAGLPEGLVNLVHGDGVTAREMMRAPSIEAISITGAVATGAAAAASCALHGKPLQAELGGNNAVIVLEDADLDAVVPQLARAAMSFSGQRCTAIRRFIVTRAIGRQFESRMIEAVCALRLGDPLDADTDIGPLISRRHLEQVRERIEQARAEGARLLCGGFEPDGWRHGHWLQPALLAGAGPHSRIVREETFGPVAVIQEADDVEQAIGLANAVPHGLIAGLASREPEARARVLEALQAGILKLAPGPLALHPAAPFGGWKASGIGPPEHGRWNRDFYARAQAIYLA